MPVLTIATPLAPTKEQAIRAVVDRLGEHGHLPTEHLEGITRAVLRRESLGSTGIGRGVAVPHAKHSGVSRLVGAVAKFPTGIEFDSIDGQPVYIVCLLVSPVDRPWDHLRVLEAVARQLRR